ncbi:MAG: hypothetical protein M0R77_06805 [Gammaproteobacteria bacterium]|nr:hypothetical protein [Gammaproteobacteria bacterium]
MHQIIRHSFHVILLCGLLAGCGGDDGGDSPPPQSGIGSPITNPGDGTTSPITYYESVGCSGTSVYVLAHQHDWQLFMNPKAYKDIAEDSCKTIFIHLTAGDAGKGNGPEGNPYYADRITAAINAVEFVADSFAEPPAAPADRTPTEVGGYHIESHRYGNTVSLFLNLPDGGTVDGGGYEETGYESLKKLFEQKSVTAVDGALTLAGWDELLTLMQNILAEEVRGEPTYINGFDWNTVRNPADHWDHFYAAKAVEGLASRLGTAGIRLFLGDSEAKLRSNLRPGEVIDSTSVYAVTVDSMRSSVNPEGWANTGFLSKASSCLWRAPANGPLNGESLCSP